MLLNSETNTCETVQSRMTALWDSELSPPEAASMRLHISRCPVCTQAFEQIQQTLKTADAWKVEGSDVWESLQKRLSSEPVKQEVSLSDLPSQAHPLSRLLRTKRTITAEQLREALYVQSKTNGDIGEILVDLGFATERDVVESKAQAEGLPFIDLIKHKPEPSAVNVVPAHVARRLNALPVKKDGTKLWVALKDPRNIVALDEIRMVSRCQIAPLAAVPADLEQAIAEAYPTELPTDSVQTNRVDADQDDLHAVLTEMRALRNEIQELRGEVGTLRRLLSATRQAAPAKPARPLPPLSMMPLALPEDHGLGLL